jgi:hypothetical protein
MVQLAGVPATTADDWHRTVDWVGDRGTGKTDTFTGFIPPRGVLPSFIHTVSMNVWMAVEE